MDVEWELFYIIGYGIIPPVQTDNSGFEGDILTLQKNLEIQLYFRHFQMIGQIQVRIDLLLVNYWG